MAERLQPLLCHSVQPWDWCSRPFDSARWSLAALAVQIGAVASTAGHAGRVVREAFGFNEWRQLEKVNVSIGDA
jgi:hypothetical protein